MSSETMPSPRRVPPSSFVGDGLCEEVTASERSIDQIIVRVRNLSKNYQIYERPRDRLKQSLYPRLQRLIGKPAKQYHREFWALKDVSFKVRRGETFGIIGRNGSGKSTLLQILAGTLAQTSGEVNVNGRVAALLELGSGFNPEFTGRENVFLNGRILGLSQNEIEVRYDQIVEFADIGEFIDQPVKTYSSGMFVRLAFAVQAHIDASIVLIDEALAVGDVFFRQKCYARLEQLRKSGAAVLLVSHSMPDIEQYCERVPRFIGSASVAAKHYYLLHQATISNSVSHSCDLANQPLAIQPNPTIRRPSFKAFIDLSKKSQINNGKALCAAVALTNEWGKPCNVFQQGDAAVFHYEFDIKADISTPICGVVITNDRGIIVHGKNSWQYDDEVPLQVESGKKLVCQQQVKLDLAPGDYTFEVGLASISHEVFSTIHERLCHMPNVGYFSIGLASIDGVAVLTHHGIANLPGKIIQMVF
jgi:lipopolysaccharide transport system ATP-binding protein